MKSFTSQEINSFVSMPIYDEKIILANDASYPKISIVTVSYNQDKFLERTILSVLNQNYPNMEYIIIDGGSTDNSIEIIKKYAKYFTYWVSEKDQGQADAINKGFIKSSGEILAWLNSDDIYLPDTLSKISMVFKSASPCDIFYGNVYEINEDDVVVREIRNTPLPFPQSYLYGGFGFFQVGVFWKREPFFNVGCLNKNYTCCMDDDLFMRFIEGGYKFRFAREFLGCARLHPLSKTSTMTPVFQKEGYMVRKKYMKFANNSLPAILIKNFVRLNRFFYFLIQGDIDWVIKKCINHIRNKSRVLKYLPLC